MSNERRLRAAIRQLLRDDNGRAQPQSAAQILDQLAGRSLVVTRIELTGLFYVLERERKIVRRVVDGVVRWSVAPEEDPSDIRPLYS